MTQSFDLDAVKGWIESPDRLNLPLLAELAKAATPGLRVEKAQVRLASVTATIRHEKRRSANPDNFHWLTAIVACGPDLVAENAKCRADLAAACAEVERLRIIESAAKIIAEENARFNDSDRCYVCGQRWTKDPETRHARDCAWVKLDAAIAAAAGSS